MDEYPMNRFLPGFATESRMLYVMAEQKSIGFKVDQVKLTELVQDLSDRWEELNRELDECLPLFVKAENTYEECFTMKGELRACVRKYMEGCGLDPMTVAGPFTKVSFGQMKLSQLAKVKEFLLSLGWEPKMFTDTGSPKLTDPDSKEPCPTLLQIPGAGQRIGALISEYNTVKHRKGVVDGWFEVAKENEWRIGAGIIGFTNTHRYRHSGVVNVPRPTTAWGDRMRDLFIADDGCVLLGSDASGLENRVFASYANTPELTDLVLGRGEIDREEHVTEEQWEYWLKKRNFHAFCWQLLGEFCSNINVLKNVEYAYLYGGQATRLGLTADTYPNEMEPVDVGREIIELMLHNVPGLKKLKANVEMASMRGYLVLCDRRQLRLRVNDHGFVLKHKAMNLLFQGGGSAIVKMATLKIHDKLIDAGIPFDQVGHFHDEVQIQVREKDADDSIRLINASWSEVGKELKLNVPIEGETQVGHSWRDTH